MIRELWYLPRPNGTKYPGGFPLHFEKRLFQTYRPSLILQPFGGKAEYGLRVDINPEVLPDIVADACHLPFADESFDFVLCDPPYSTDLSGRLYKTGPVNDNQYIKEAVRVCKIGGYVALYHWVMPPRPKGTRYDRLIVIITRIRHHARFCAVFQRVLTLFGDERLNSPARRLSQDMMVLDIPEVKQASIRDNSGTSPFGPDVNYYGSYENSDGSAWVNAR